MKKVINITIGNVVFSVEEDAYQQLANYLDEIKKHFQSAEDATEIVSDIEVSIAEKFTARAKGKEQTVTSDDVSAVIEAMGTIADFVEFDETAPPPTPQRGPRRLYRNADDKVIGGVAAGTAAYFNIDPVVPRLLFAASIFFGGFGIVLYILLWLIVPLAKTAPQKLQMRGEAVTLSKISTVAESATTIAKESDGIKQLIALPIELLRATFKALGRVAQILVPLARIIIGAGFILAAALALIVIAVVLFVIIIGGGTPSADPATQVVIESLTAAPAWLTLSTLALYLFVAIPLSAILLGGISLLIKKNIFTTPITTVLIVSWLIAIGTLLTFGAIKAPTITQGVAEVVRNETQQEPVTRQYTDLADFTKVAVAGGNVTLAVQAGSEPSVTITALQQRHDSLRVTSNNGLLEIRARDLFNICFFNCYQYDAVKIVITNPTIERIDLSGSATGALKVQDTNQEMTINLSGSTRLAADLNVANLNLRASGSSRVKLIGAVDTLTLDLSGSSRIYAYEFTARDIDLSGSGSTRVNASAQESLRTKISGSGTVRYLGDNINVTERTSGSARITHVNQDEADVEHSLDHLFEELPQN